MKTSCVVCVFFIFFYYLFLLLLFFIFIFFYYYYFFILFIFYYYYFFFIIFFIIIIFFVRVVCVCVRTCLYVKKIISVTWHLAGHPRAAGASRLLLMRGFLYCLRNLWCGTHLDTCAHQDTCAIGVLNDSSYIFVKILY